MIVILLRFYGGIFNFSLNQHLFETAVPLKWQRIPRFDWTVARLFSFEMI